MGTTAASSRRTAVGPAPQGQADGLIRLSGRIPASRGHPINHHVAGAALTPCGVITQRRVLAYPYKGYWSPADTVKERAQLEEMYYQGHCPWMVWDPERSGAAKEAAPVAAGSVAVTSA